MQRFVNLKKSKGNFFVDIDGNRILDLHCNFSSVPLGYNHDALVNARTSDLYDRFLGNRINVTHLPPDDYADILREVVMPIAPTGTNQVHLTDGTITQANESALLFALLKYSKDHKVADV
jgi:4-aminobutyrate aminotransferase/(S)-3-amino-2-methylpropionate transaminase